MIKSRTILVCLLSGLALLAPSAAFAVVVVVTSAADTLTFCAFSGSGECTLRDAITYSNANPGPGPIFVPNLIQFNIPGSGVQTITLLSDLPAITTATIVDGYSQPGASPNTLAVGDNAVLLIELFGSVDPITGAGVHSNCLAVTGGNGSVIQGLIVHQGFSQVALVLPWSIGLYHCCNRVVGNFIGLDPTGTMGPGSGFLGGIFVGSSRNQIGGTAPADRNVINSGKILNEAVAITGNANIVEGNYIGTNAAGNAGVGSIEGVEIDSGAPSAAAFNFLQDNVISANGAGVEIFGTGNALSGNFIGTDATGTAPLGNASFGVAIGGSGNTIGTFLTLSSLTGNRIAFNGGTGVLIGTDPSVVNNSILSNSIFSNGGLGIDLSLFPPPDGVTPNVPCETPITGPNNSQNYPVLTSATKVKLKTKIEGTLNSAPDTIYDIQLFSNSSCDPSGFGQGETFLDDVFVTTDGSCNASFTAFVPVSDAPVGRFITATATDPAGNTSEFSACQQVGAVPFLTITRLLIEGPVRVAPGVPVEFPFRVETKREGRPGAGQVPSGEVVVSDNAGNVCRAELSTTGEGTCPLTFGSAGTNRVRAHYLGNSTFDDSTSPPLRVLVGMPGGQ